MLRLIIVDDEELICTHIATGLNYKSLGYEVAAQFTSAREALERIPELKPDVVITDVLMPGITGLVFIEALKNSHPQIDVVILSGHDNFRYAQQAIALGVRYYALKPFSQAEMTRILLELKARRSHPQAGRKPSHSLEACLAGCTGMAAAAAFRFGRSGEADSFRPLKPLLLQAVRETLGEGALLYPEEGQVLAALPGLSGADYAGLRDRLAEVVRRFAVAAADASAAGSGEPYCLCGACLSLSAADEAGDMRRKALAALDRSFFDGPGQHVRMYEDSPPPPCGKGQQGAGVRGAASSIVLALLSADGKTACRMLRDYLEEIVQSKRPDRRAFLYECCMFYLLMGLAMEESGFPDTIIPVERFHDRLSAMGTGRQAVEYFTGELTRISGLTGGVDLRSDNSMVMKVKQYISRHYARNIRLEELSKNFYLSAAYLSTYFKKQTGRTISEYLILLRIEQAKKLLQNSSKTVSEIAEEVGYSGYRYFCTLFKKVTGQTPIQYRLLHVKNSVLEANMSLWEKEDFR